MKNKYFYAIGAFLFSSVVCNTVNAQIGWVKEFNASYNSSLSTTNSFKNTDKSLPFDSYSFMALSSLIDALQSMYMITKDEYYLDNEKKNIDDVISRADISENIPNNQFRLKDKFSGWISAHDGNNEVPLYESYLFQYIAKSLYELNKIGWAEKSEDNLNWYNNTLSFVEQNIWNKWIVRSTKSHNKEYAIFLGVRTHMAAHWAGIALFLKEITKNNEIKKECTELYNTFDLLLKRNLKLNPSYPDAYIWNSTWDNVDGTQAKMDTSTVIQDVSHGNHIISYLNNSFEVGNTNWSNNDIVKFCNTLKYVIYNKQLNTFADNVDGTASSARPGWGNFQADGWIKLGAFDKDVNNIYINYAQVQKLLMKKYGQELQYYANLARNNTFQK